ncbi:MAG: hypothetical protein KJ558_05560 [Gammaproteobacteria bacterium]|nr:hypothetical protein [Gammaproteobacteria bacterium]MBU1654283.1 hypothetical protein [Gammaproteobacteria bacterium]MBU1960634.1 hypothetical protein [Gammaproteobacteria bacterium]
MSRPAALLLFMMLAVVGYASSDHGHSDHEEAHELAERGVIRPLTEILEQARQIHDGRVLDVVLKHEKEHEAYVYELHILDPQGVVWMLEFNAVSKELVERRRH